MNLVIVLCFLVGFLGGYMLIDMIGNSIRCKIDTEQRIKHNLPLDTPYRRQQGWPLR